MKKKNLLKKKTSSFLLRNLKLLPLLLLLLMLPLSIVVMQQKQQVQQNAASVASATASTGCGLTGWATNTDINGTISYGGLTRTYILHIPTGYNPSQPMPLMYILHGSGMTSSMMRQMSQMNTYANTKGFIVVYPQGTTNASNVPGWNAGVGQSYATVDDVGFLNALHQKLISGLCIDQQKVMMSGISDGAEMAYDMACNNTPWISVLGEDAGTLPMIITSCHLAHVTPIVGVNGAKDPLIPYNLASLSVQLLAEKAGCQSTGTNAAAATSSTVTTTTYTSCSLAPSSTFYDVADGGHQWPGGGMILPQFIYGPYDSSINVSDIFSNFLLQSSNPSLPTSVLSPSNTPIPTSLPTDTPVPTVTATPTAIPTQPSSDTVPPSVTITSPENNSVVSKSKFTTIQVVASDNIGVTKVIFYVNNIATCTDYSAPYSCKWKSSGPGTYTLTATAFDAMNNSSSSQIIVTAD